MKTWMLVATVALASISASAQRQDGAPSLPANESARAELIKEIEANRTALLPQAEPLPQVTVHHQPRLNEIKAAVDSAKITAQLDQAKKDFANWKIVVLRELYNENRSFISGETFPAFAARRMDEVKFVMALHQQFAAQRVAAETALARSMSRKDSSWAEVFDNASPFRGSTPLTGYADGAVRVAAPYAAGDPAYYDKIRALLLSRGVSRQIIDTAIAEGMRQKVDPMIVLSVINQESNFRKNAYNRGSGCVGLMQLDPATAADMGARGSLYDAGTNIKAGVKYLKWIANSFFKMNLDMSDLSKVPAEKLKIVLASYNWGIGNVSKSLRRHGAAALDRVAPRETRNYMAAIPQRITGWFASI